MDILKDECPICTENNLAQVKGERINAVRMTCCGTLICESCYDKMWQSADATGIPFSCPICRTLPSKTAKEEFNRALDHAKIGRPWAQEMVGQYYMLGYAVTKSDKKAFEFYSLAAEQGNANAQYCLGGLYQDGRGVTQSYEKAFLFYQKAAEQGLAEAQTSVGYYYFYGIVIEKSLEKGFQWFHRASESGSRQSNLNVGLCYYNGDGVEKDYEKAVHYYTLAAEQNDKQAHLQLALCFIEGEGVKQSLVKAIYWIRQCLKDNEDEKMCAKAKKFLDETLSLSSGMCSSCGHIAQLHLKCSKCLSAYYCNVNCQTTHWKNGHKQECQKP